MKTCSGNEVFYDPAVPRSLRASPEGLHPDLQKLYADLAFKKRILFLSGQRDTMENLLETAAELKAIGHIIAEMEAEKVPDNDPQKVAATDIPCSTATDHWRSGADWPAEMALSGAASKQKGGREPCSPPPH